MKRSTYIKIGIAQLVLGAFDARNAPYGIKNKRWLLSEPLAGIWAVALILAWPLMTVPVLMGVMYRHTSLLDNFAERLWQTIEKASQ